VNQGAWGIMGGYSLDEVSAGRVVRPESCLG
jgi:hypothetical protein